MAASGDEDALPGLTLEAKYDLIFSVGEECIKEDDLRELLTRKLQPICYDGFEPSGRIHIAQGIMKALNVNKLTKAGCIFKFWVADWFAQLNNKMGGDLEKIQTVGKYMIEVWKAVGMNLDNVEFLWSSEEINNRAAEYWPLVMDIAKRNTLPRILRCSQIMGRSKPQELNVATIMYACMQCADIFLLKADICQLGLDQRKVNMLAREYCAAAKRKFKPVILSHHMLPGLLEGQEKMSKSNTESAIFMEDEEEDVIRKLKGAFCPPKVEGNPCLDYVKHIALPWFKQFEVESSTGKRVYVSMEELCRDYELGNVTPDELKMALACALNRILQPVRDHFKTNAEAKELLQKVRGYKVTR